MEQGGGPAGKWWAGRQAGRQAGKEFLGRHSRRFKSRALEGAVAQLLWQSDYELECNGLTRSRWPGRRTTAGHCASMLHRRYVPI